MASGKIYDCSPRGKIYLKPFFASKDVMERTAQWSDRGESLPRGKNNPQ